MISIPRRRVLAAALALPFASAYGQSCARTAAQTAGPFYKSNAPQRGSLLEGGAKNLLVLTGRVLTQGCKPVPNALLDFWQADEEGDYDNKGFRFRGRLNADAQGRYRVETAVPGAYFGRTRHIHVKVGAPGRQVLTTQLYFPDEPGNRRDPLYRRELEMRLVKKERLLEGSYDFVVEA